ncbi:Ig-like domain-containing protein [uncultured Thiodictyon sp.]|uniref:Ig-like domain-containing protein n=1 Tax=uncultured Thiodictyon sp. TaxID=1846217 RepID=UPI0025CF369C|nr:Ig-like domain-containing protein [uncultured Thiodictyon sp.]
MKFQRVIVPRPTAMVLGLAVMWSGAGQAATCTLSPTTPTIKPGQSVTWSYHATGFRNTPSRNWTFQGGNPSSSTSASRAVSYAKAGTFSTSLRLNDGDTVAKCTTTLTVGTAADTQAPSSPTTLSAVAIGTGQINLTWAAATDNVAVTGYRVERCAGASCTNFAQIATPVTTTYSDTGLAADTYRYRVRAVDAAGNLGGYSPTANATIGTADTVAPTASISTTAASPLTPPQTVTLTVNASDNLGVTRVEFYDGSTLKATDTAAPYSYAWSVTSADAGTHVWTAKAYDAAGNVGSSNLLSLVVMGAVSNVSINSTSTDSSGPNSTVVPSQAQVIDANYHILAINDLGMHCGDLDTRIASILPPFQVMLGQVIQKGTASKPVLNPAGVTLAYSAVANPTDPILTQTTLAGLKSDGSSYKTNFWEGIKNGAYDAFYPGGLGLTPLATGGFPTTADRGLPVANVENLYIGPDGIVDSPAGQPGSHDGFLSAVQHAMPGVDAPYVANTPQAVEEHYQNKPFFVNFPFGYVAQGVNWHEGAGIPVSAFDDFGRENPFPLVRVQAKNAAGTVLTTTDTVLPISGETSCSNCHADPTDVQGSRSSTPTDTLLNAGLPVATQRDDPDTTLPARVSIEYATDINVLRLHDLKHGAAYVSPTGGADTCTITAAAPNGSPSCLINKALVQKKPVVCQVCHYTPALDLAQVGPQSGAPGTPANGRNQVAHKTNSNVMHGHHGSLPGNLFEVMPAPVQDANGVITNQATRLTALENSCYQCHPGKNTKCLRGAMFNGGMLCSDCHGSMTQIGNDFSRNVSTTNPGAFILAKDFYTNPATPRVPWANEPGCGSCHTGDAAANLTVTAGVLVNTKDSAGNKDGLRLRQAFKTGDAKATPIVPVNKRFAEPVVPVAFNGFTNPAAGNPRLYRMSTGHGGVMCEGCHGATHAEWPNGIAGANDNLTAKQLQGHTGTISECTTCHTTTALAANTLDGPHGMHLVNDSRFWSSAHKSLAQTENAKPGGGSCGACHGADHLGTVLSRAPVTRTWLVENSNRTVAAGQMVACDTCHSLNTSFGK